MPPVSISISDVIYVDFKSKQVVDRQVLQFDKTELLREGLINFDRLIRRGRAYCIYDHKKVGYAIGMDLKEWTLWLQKS